MNVQELIELLQQQDPTSEVVLRDPDTDDFYDPSVTKQFKHLIEYTEETKQKRVNAAPIPFEVWGVLGYQDNYPKHIYNVTRTDESKIVIELQ